MPSSPKPPSEIAREAAEFAMSPSELRAWKLLEETPELRHVPALPVCRAIAGAIDEARAADVAALRERVALLEGWECSEGWSERDAVEQALPEGEHVHASGDRDEMNLVERAEWIVSRAERAEDRIAELEGLVSAYRLLVEGKNGLIAAYRVGRPPSEATWKKLERAKKKIEAAERGKKGSDG